MRFILEMMPVRNTASRRTPRVLMVIRTLRLPAGFL